MDGKARYSRREESDRSNNRSYHGVWALCSTRISGGPFGDIPVLRFPRLRGDTTQPSSMAQANVKSLVNGTLCSEANTNGDLGRCPGRRRSQYRCVAGVPFLDSADARVAVSKVQAMAAASWSPERLSPLGTARPRLHGEPPLRSPNPPCAALRWKALPRLPAAELSVCPVWDSGTRVTLWCCVAGREPCPWRFDLSSGSPACRYGRGFPFALCAHRRGDGLHSGDVIRRSGLT